MRIIFAGTSDFAVPILERLIETREQEIKMVITQPDRRRGRGLKEVPSPVKELSLKYRLPLAQPVSINDPAFQPVLEKMAPDLAVVAAYGQKLSARILSLPRFGWINIHPSLLPRYRGAAPVNYALWHGDTQTGVTIFRMTEQMDAGPIISQRAVPINEEETAVELGHKLALVGRELLIETLQQFEDNKVSFKAQDESAVTYAPRLKKENGLINWTDSAERIRNQVRAMQPWPGAYTFYKSPKQGNLKIAIMRVETSEPAETSEKPTAGTVIDLSVAGIVVTTGAGRLTLKELKPAGKRPMTAQAFINGYRIKKGDRFGTD